MKCRVLENEISYLHIPNSVKFGICTALEYGTEDHRFTTLQDGSKITDSHKVHNAAPRDVLSSEIKVLFIFKKSYGTDK